MKNRIITIGREFGSGHVAFVWGNEYPDPFGIKRAQLTRRLQAVHLRHFYVKKGRSAAGQSLTGKAPAVAAEGVSQAVRPSAKASPRNPRTDSRAATERSF